MFVPRRGRGECSGGIQTRFVQDSSAQRPGSGAAWPEPHGQDASPRSRAFQPHRQDASPRSRPFQPHGQDASPRSRPFQPHRQDASPRSHPFQPQVFRDQDLTALAEPTQPRGLRAPRRWIHAGESGVWPRQAGQAPSPRSGPLPVPGDTHTNPFTFLSPAGQTLIHLCSYPAPGSCGLPFYASLISDRKVMGKKPNQNKTFEKPGKMAFQLLFFFSIMRKGGEKNPLIFVLILQDTM